MFAVYLTFYRVVYAFNGFVHERFVGDVFVLKTDLDIVVWTLLLLLLALCILHSYTHIQTQMLSLNVGEYVTAIFFMISPFAINYISRNEGEMC